LRTRQGLQQHDFLQVGILVQFDRNGLQRSEEPLRERGILLGHLHALGNRRPTAVKNSSQQTLLAAEMLHHL
jgi:hypothetical protein